MLTLCCPFIEYSTDVKRTLNSFQEFVNEAKILAEDLKILHTDFYREGYTTYTVCG